MTGTAAVLARRTLLALWLLAVWLLLWGTWRPDLVALGVVAALIAVRWSRLPAPPLRTRIRWRRVPRLLPRFALDLIRSSWQVAVATARTGRGTRSAVLELRLAPEATDTAVILACNRISLEPGTIVIDIDRRHDRLFVYQLDTPDREAVEATREAAQRLVDDVTATFAPREVAGRASRSPDDEDGGAG